MQLDSQRSRLAQLRSVVMEWKIRLGSREAVAVAITEKHAALGYDRLTGIYFDSGHGDSYVRAKNAADRIFRWLDDETKGTNFLPINFEESILCAMPDDLVLVYENARLAGRGLRVRGFDIIRAQLNPVGLLVDIAKETAEAQAAIANLVDGATQQELQLAERELAEAEESVRRARAAVTAQLRGGLQMVANSQTSTR